ncbi:MAG: FKBP-type peptidyl-prolyl cis-trans isomerase [Chloroflexi bacterium]|nr:MAG: FKBP-type peptidyl-prolyl cis-trans isomerase [Chloroflexota bacterium]MBL1195824.1 FKBP-type peptidyl-prolyl cis-trans isomerase [Chloroflexota bacterium]NOH13116.1 FKBP-type peptidyl-prolyl cis-trans isomerase [Chloroflexota bacterium]
MARRSRRKQEQQNQTIRYLAIAVIVAVILWLGFTIYNNLNTGSTASVAGNLPEYNPSDLATTASGLQYLDFETGNGANPQPGQTVSVHYTGWFTNGEKFDSSVDRGTPFEFVLGTGGVIPGWDEGVATMQAGGTRLLVIPSDLGYGASDYGPIPGGSTLVFQVELLEVK